MLQSCPTALGADGNLTPTQAFDMGSPLTDIETCRKGDTTYVLVSAEGPSGKMGRGEVHVLQVNADKTVAAITAINPIVVGAPPSLLGPPTVTAFGADHVLKADTNGPTVSICQLSRLSRPRGRVAPARGAGYLPDMIKPAPDCSMLVTANEGEGFATSAGVFSNPEGSVSVITFNADMTAVATNEEVGWQPAEVAQAYERVAACSRLAELLICTRSSRRVSQRAPERTGGPHRRGGSTSTAAQLGETAEGGR